MYKEYTVDTALMQRGFMVPCIEVLLKGIHIGVTRVAHGQRHLNHGLKNLWVTHPTKTNSLVISDESKLW